MMNRILFAPGNCKNTTAIIRFCSFIVISIVGNIMAVLPAEAQEPKVITINASEIKTDVNPAMWGVFFEDINMGADGGISAELIKNRSFEFFKPMMGWTILGKPLTEGDFLVTNRQKMDSANPRFLHITLHNNS